MNKFEEFEKRNKDEKKPTKKQTRPAKPSLFGVFKSKEHKKAQEEKRNKAATEEKLKKIELRKLDEKLNSEEQRSQSKKKFLETAQKYEELKNVHVNVAGEDFVYSFSTFTRDKKAIEGNEMNKLLEQVEKDKISIESGRIGAKFKLTSTIGRLESLELEFDVPIQKILKGDIKTALSKLTNTTFGATLEWYKKTNAEAAKAKEQQLPNPKIIEDNVKKIEKQGQKTGGQISVLKTESLTSVIIDYPHQNKQIHLATGNGLIWHLTKVRDGKQQEETTANNTEDAIEFISSTPES